MRSLRYVPLQMLHSRDPRNRKTQIPRYKFKSNQFEIIPRDTKKPVFFDSVDFGDASFSVEPVIALCCSVLQCVAVCCNVLQCVAV